MVVFPNVRITGSAPLAKILLQENWGTSGPILTFATLDTSHSNVPRDVKWDANVKFVPLAIRLGFETQRQGGLPSDDAARTESPE